MITNATKPTTTLVNAARIPSFETWDSIETNYNGYLVSNGETRTWQQCESIFQNVRVQQILTTIPNSGTVGWITYNAYPTTVQSFTGNGSKIQSVTFYLGMIIGGVTSGDVTAVLYNHSGTFGTSSVPTGSPIATSDPVPFLNIVNGTTPIATTFSFSGSNKITLTENQKYCIGYSWSGGGIASHVLTRLINASAYPGNVAEFDGVSWTAYSAYDLPMIIYTDTQPIINTAKP